MKLSKIIVPSMVAILALLLSSCNNSSTKKANTKVVENNTEQVLGVDGKPVEDPNANTALEGYSNVVKKKGAVSNRGGYIKILVNKQPITNYEIQRRVNFLKLRRVGGKRTSVAEKELIEQNLKLSEAKRIRVLASDEQVDQAFANFAKRNRTTPQRLGVELGKLGVGSSHFKDFIRSQMSWQNVISRSYQQQTITKSERDVVSGLRKTGSAKPEVTEYNMKRFIFVVPETRRNKSSLAIRKTEANALRQRFTSCEAAHDLIRGLKDVSVQDERHVLEPELPEQWKSMVINPSPNGTTKTLESKHGVEFIAVCNKRLVSDDRAAQVSAQQEDFGDFNTKASEYEESYLKKIRDRAKIVYQ